MIERQEIITAASEFLCAVARFAKANLREQVYVTPSHEELMWFHLRPDRALQKVVNPQLMVLYETSFPSDSPEHEHLKRVLLSVLGISEREVSRYYLRPLVQHWLEIRRPFAFQNRALRTILNEFCDAVLEKRVILRAKDVIEGLDPELGTLNLENGVRIRRMAEQDKGWGMDYVRTEDQSIVGKDSRILETQVEFREANEEEMARKYDIVRTAVLCGLRLAAPGDFYVQNAGLKSNYGGMLPAGATVVVGNLEVLGLIRGSMRYGSRRANPDHVYGLNKYCLDRKAATKLVASWPKIRSIVESPNHYLGLAARRFLDAGSRDRNDDAVVDYTIGLESLLLEGVRDELSYRFSLRGATVLTAQGGQGSRREHYEQLRRLYDIRSRIVHGDAIGDPELGQVRVVGEESLRHVWWWFFNRDEPSLKAATRLLDDMILQ